MKTIPLSFNHELSFGIIRRKRRGRWLLLALLFPLIGAALAHTLTGDIAPRAATPVAAEPAMETPDAEPLVAPAAASEEAPDS